MSDRPLSLSSARTETACLVAWSGGLEPRDDRERVAIREIQRCASTLGYWLKQLEIAREMPHGDVTPRHPLDTPARECGGDGMA